MNTWVRPDSDKPHRCPQCWGIAARAWSPRGYGPRTVMSCPGECGVQWRHGGRAWHIRTLILRNNDSVREGRDEVRTS